MARLYVLSVESTLFGDWRLICRWGRIARPTPAQGGQMQSQTFLSQELALAALVRKQRQKLRRG
ncbi:MAG: WGR domain-containing protein [Rhodobacteraceae bacterium]|nr:WGR domain-containing protein [Paracoccaceae bacterium]